MKIRIISPAKSIERSKLEYAKSFLEHNGFSVEISKHAAGRHHYFSGTDNERLQDFQEAIDDPNVDAILCSRGGYGTVRIVDQLNFDGLRAKPKPILGFSDITVLHNHLHTNYGLTSVHCTAPLNFEENTKEALDSMINVLKKKENNYESESQPLNRNGNVEAKIVGGNLSILASLIGTNSDVETKGKILLIEEIGEAIYSVDRMMWSLKKSGKLEGLAGFIVGGMTNMKDSDVPFGCRVEEVIAEAVSEFDFPLCFGFPSGHIADNRAVVIGRKVYLEVGEKVVFRQ